MADEVYGEGYEMTALQKHVAFFDSNKDGIVYPRETFQGFRKLGFGIGFSTMSALFINGGLSPKTKPEGKFPSLFLPIYINRIQKAKHGSDSGAYDTEGRFVPEKFENIFKKHAKTKPDALTKDELLEMLKDNREPGDRKGWVAAHTEWRTLFALAKDKDGFIQKEDVRSVYDGSLFLKMEEEHSCKKKKA